MSASHLIAHRISRDSNESLNETSEHSDRCHIALSARSFCYRTSHLLENLKSDILGSMRIVVVSSHSVITDSRDTENGSVNISGAS
jgi:hypothetical protein